MPAASLSPKSSIRSVASSTRKGAGRCLGFTLVEVMVALAIAAIALAAGLRATGALTDNAERLEQVLSAQWCADNELTGQRLVRAFPGVGDTEFTCRQLGREYRGMLRVRPTPNPGFRRVDAIVTDENARHLVTVSAVIGRN